MYASDWWQITDLHLVDCASWLLSRSIKHYQTLFVFVTGNHQQHSGGLIRPAALEMDKDQQQDDLRIQIWKEEWNRVEQERPTPQTLA